MKINKADLDDLVVDKYLSVQKHPTEDLYIYNYTDKCTFDKKWNDLTIQCRGLIIDSKGEIKAKPFKKFFNVEELQGQNIELPTIPYKVYEKYDGSLGISYFVNGRPYIATRGSFESEQALRGTEILHNKFLGKYNFSDSYTYLFEIIYPENRIVVNYGMQETLILLAVVNIRTGEELPIEDLIVPFPKAQMIQSDIDKLKELDNQNKEGFVIRFNNGFRAKVKFEEYVRLHRLVTGVTPKRIWDILRNHESINELLERVPEEFESWVKKTISELRDDYMLIEEAQKKMFLRINSYLNNVKMTKPEEFRKEFALMAQESKHPSILFKMLDNESYEEIIWKLIRPRGDVSFKIEI